MRIVPLLVALALLSASTLRAEDKDPLPPPVLPDAFKALTHQRLVEGWVHVYYDPRLILPPADGDGAPYEIEGAGVLAQAPFRVRLSVGGKTLYGFSCNTGGSGDPNCELSVGDKPLLAIDGDAIAFPGDGCVYSVARANNHFPLRRKFCETRKGLSEVAQPARYVGLASTALRELRLFADRKLARENGRIPEGGFVEILIQDRGLYLLRDAFGLTGWIKLPQTPDGDSRTATDIEGFFFLGD